MALAEMPRISRRVFFREAAGLGLVASSSFFISSCGESPQKLSLPSLQKEQENTLQPGDVISFQGSHYLFRDKQMFLIPDFNYYKKVTKMEDYGRRVVGMSSGNFNKYPVGQVPQEKWMIDPYTGQLKENKKKGGEIFVCFYGFLTDNGIPFGEIRASDVFETIRGNNGLKPLGWSDSDVYVYPYGKKGLESYGPKDTAKNPEITVSDVIEYIKEIKRNNPLVQINFLGHSLGCNLALLAAAANLDCVNNIVLFHGPIRGIRGDITRKIQTTLVDQFLYNRYGVEDKVSEYLFKLWDSKDYQEWVDELVLLIAKKRRRILSVTAKEDEIVPVESTKIGSSERSKHLVIETGFKRETIWDLLALVKIHGAGLGHKQSLKEVQQMIGRNLAVAA